MKPTIFSTILFAGILSTMWLAAVNHNAATEEIEYVTITPDMSDAIRVGMTMDEVVAILGKEPQGVEVSQGLNEPHELHYWTSNQKRLYVATNNGVVSRVFIRN